MSNVINNLNMLILPGGGIKGYMPSLTMQKICKEFNIAENKFIDDFHVVGGTSIGGITSLALACGITPSRLVRLFEEERNIIFPSAGTGAGAIQFGEFAITGNGIYKRDGLIASIKKVLPDADKIKIKDVEKKVLVTTLKTDNNGVKKPLYITNIKSIDDSSTTQELTVLDACCMTSAAPVYFDPYIKNNETYVDGGVWRNNPVVAILNGMRSEYIHCNRQCILTIGCGYENFSMKPKASRPKNLKIGDGLGIIIDTLNAAIGASEAASHHDILLYTDYNCINGKTHYCYFQPFIGDGEDVNIDNITDKFFQFMKDKVESTFKTEMDNLTNLYNNMLLYG